MLPITMQYFLCRALRRHADRVALIWEGESVTYGELDRRSTALAASLAEAGLRPGARLAYLLDNTPAFFETELAAAKAGLVKVPVNVRLASAEIATILQDCGAGAIVFEPRFADAIATAHACLAEPPLLVSTADRPEGARSYSSMIDGPKPEFQPAEVSPGDIYSIRYSGGTTGRPKGIVHSNASCVAIALSVMRQYEVHHEERSLQVTHPAHGANFVWPGLFGKGATMCLITKFDAGAVLEAIERHRLTRVAMVPTMWYALLDHPDFPKADLSGVATFAYMSAPMAVERLRQARELLGPRIMGIYTLSESAVLSTILAKEDLAVEEPELGRRLASCGREADDVRLRIVSDDMRDVAEGEVGEILLSSPGNMLGYWRMPEETSATLVDGWVKTGDVARRDAEGFVYIVDRKNDKIVTGAFNVYPREVEEILYQHPSVREAAVVGIPADRWGEAVVAFVALHRHASFDADDLLAFCRNRLAHFKVPKAVHLVDELPRTPVGKISRRALAEPYWKDRERRIG